MTVADSSSAVLPASQVAELIASLVKALRAFQMYLPNNPIHQRASQNVQAAFGPIWAATDEITLTVAETDFLWEDQVVYHQLSKAESIAWTLYKDGLRVLTLRKGVEQEEITQFLELVNRARFLATDAPDDLLTLLWEREFLWISYVFAEPFSEVTPAADQRSTPEVQPEARRQAVEEEAARPSGMVDLDDFDGTLYFLDEQEINYVIDAVRHEYSRDARGSALSILFDLYEMERAPAVREEIHAILDALLPNLLNKGEFRVVASILRELRTVEQRVSTLSPAERARVREFEERLSEPAIVRQLVQSLDEASTRPGDEDVRDVLAELRAAALGPILTMLPRLYSGTVRHMLEQTVDRLASQNSAEVLRLLRDGIDEDNGDEALPALIGVCGRLKLQGAVTGLGDLLSRDNDEIRLAAVQALDAIGTPGALAHLDRALEDPDRAVRVAAVKAVGARGYRSALRRVENVVQGKSLKDLDMSEKKAFFEAYGAIAGASGIKLLGSMLGGRGLLRMKEPPEVRACAALALGRIGTTEARQMLEAAQDDKELVVRNAVKQALREGAA
ncbi:MAG TPA: HEAT repeat domain-containing protein [Gemmatimonadales bacterium]|nr:HEAT repeat domain-containing protein [Gemmatimonadales bacterium]